MNEEEKRTLDFTKKYLEDNTGKYKFTNEDLTVLVNLIDKQQQEIEVVAKTYDRALDMLVDKDNKIKEKIKELENKEFLYKEEKRFNEEEIKFNYAKRILQELLGEENENLCNSRFTFWT